MNKDKPFRSFRSLLSFALIISFIYGLPALIPIVASQLHMVGHAVEVKGVDSPVHWFGLKDDGHPHIEAAYQAYAALFTAVLLLVTLISGIFGYFETSHTQSRSKSRSKTLDLISRQTHDNDIITMFKNLRELRKRLDAGDDVLGAVRINHYYKVGKLNREIDTEFEATKKDFELCIQVLNYYEIWAIGIRHHALEEQMLKEWWRTSLVGDFTDLLPFVLGYRDATGVRQAFVMAENLADIWATADERTQCKDVKTKYDNMIKAQERDAAEKAKAAKKDARGIRSLRRKSIAARAA